VRGLDGLPAEAVCVGDLEDFEEAIEGVDLIVANSNGRQASSKVGGVKHLRAGIPVFDRLGAHQRIWAGYRGTMNLIFEVGNIFLADVNETGKNVTHNV